MRSLFAWTLTAAVMFASAAHAQDASTTEADDKNEGPPVTNAATASARSHFKLGVDFYRERNFRAALIEFQRAYADSPHYKLLYNLGQASLELQEYASAIDYLSDYLREGGSEISPERSAEVAETIKYLEGRIAYVSIATNEVGVELYVDDSLVGKSPLIEPVRVGAGRHKFSAVREDGAPVERRIDVAAGDKREVRLDFAPAPSTVTVQAAQPLESYTDEAPRGDSSYTAAIAMSFTTGVLLAGAITMTVLTGAAQQQYQEELLVPTSRRELDDLQSDAETKALITDIVWGATIVSGAVTAALFVLSGDESSGSAGTSEGLAVRLGAGSLHMDARF
jgi:hypothetical protein